MPYIAAESKISATGTISQQASINAAVASADFVQQATITADTTGSSQAQPAAGVVQEVGIEFVVDGVVVTSTEFVSAWQVDRSRRQSIQSFSYTIVLNEWGQAVLGDPFVKLGPATGKKDVDVYGVYRDPVGGGVYRYPLILGGIIDNVQRDSSPEGGHLEKYNGLDGGARVQRMPVTVIFPPGHGLTRDLMLRKLLTAAGDTKFALEQCRQAIKEAQFVDADPLASCQELIDVEGRTIYKNRNGYWVCPHLYTPASEVVPNWTITEDDILAISTVAVIMPADAVTEVTATGTEQLPAEEDTGDHTSCTETDTYKMFAIFVPPAYQDASGAINDIFMEPPEPLQRLHTKIIVCQTFREGVLIREETTQWSWLDPFAARYYWESSALFGVPGEWRAINGVGVAESTEPFDDGAAYIWQSEKWVVTHYQVTEHYYERKGWEGPPMYTQSFMAGAGQLGSYLDGEWYPHFYAVDTAAFVDDESLFIGPGHSGTYLGSDTRTYSWYNPETAIKDNNGLPDPFDTLEPINGVKVTGPKIGVQYNAQIFMATAREIKTVVASPDGFVAAEATYTYGWSTVPGTQYQFGNGVLSGDRNEQFLPLMVVSKTYMFAGENEHTEITTTTPYRQSPEIEVKRTGGGPPSAQYLPGFGPAEDQNQMTEEDKALAVNVRRGESRAIKVIVTAPELLVDHLPRIVKTQFPWAENEDELYEAAVGIIRDSLIVGIQLQVVGNFLMEENQWILLTHRPTGIVERKCVIDSISWSGSAAADDLTPCITTLNLQLYPDG